MALNEDECLIALSGNFEAQKVITKELRQRINSLYNAGGEGDCLVSREGQTTEEGRFWNVRGLDADVVIRSGSCPWWVPCSDDVRADGRYDKNGVCANLTRIDGGTTPEDELRNRDGRTLELVSCEGIPQNMWSLEWLILILEHYLVPNGYVLNGEVEWWNARLGTIFADEDEFTFGCSDGAGNPEQGEYILRDNFLTITGSCTDSDCKRVREYNARLERLIGDRL